MKDVFVEVHDFGFGPACGFLDITERFAGRYRWHVLTAGNAAAFIAKERPTVKIIPFNGFNRENWPAFPSLVPSNAPVLTLSHPNFAAFAATHGYRVLLVDQLDWMWETNPDGIDKVALHLVQHYFGRSSGKPSPEGTVEIRPIVSSSARPPLGRADLSGTVVGLGGMAIAGNPFGGDDYARWLLPLVLSSLRDVADAFPIRVIGGSPNLPAIVEALGDTRVSAVVGLGRHDYLGLLRGSAFQILTPGLASIYEAAAAGLSPLFQPGVNKSMLLQLDSLLDTGYPFAAAWPWFRSIRPHLKSLSPADALHLISSRIAASMRNEDDSGDILRSAIGRYARRDVTRPPAITFPASLPDGGLLLERALQSA